MDNRAKAAKRARELGDPQTADFIYSLWRSEGGFMGEVAHLKLDFDNLSAKDIENISEVADEIIYWNNVEASGQGNDNWD